jgi:hypothetical protein
MTYVFLSPIVLILSGTLFFALREHWREPNAIKVQYEPALESAKLMKDWGSWMTTVSTAVIAANGVLLQRPVTQGSLPDKFVRSDIWAYSSIIFFGLCILFAAWLLGSLPSIVSRFKKDEETEDHDIYELRLFTWIPVHVRVGAIGTYQHVFFVLGLYCLALYVTGAPFQVEF